MRWYRALTWWLVLLLSATLPLWTAWLVHRWGGHYAEWVFYGNYRRALSAVFLVSAALVVGLLRIPKRAKGLRGVGGLIFVALWLLAAAAPRPNCPEAVFLGKNGAPVAQEKTEETVARACGNG